jgi:hypothetical protein
VTGRWINRDPIGEWGGLNLYSMVRNNVIYKYDYLGLDGPFHDGIPRPKPPPTPQQQFDDWYDKEKERDNKWNDNLTPCPCKLNKPKCTPSPRTGKKLPFENPDNTKWENPSSDLFGYHNDARACMRSKTAGGSPGEQCCYDKNGDLITGGSGAGTADRAAPGSGLGDLWNNIFDPNRHHAQDVAQANLVEFLDGGQTGPNNDKYKEARPTNNKKNCKKNEVNS